MSDQPPSVKAIFDHVHELGSAAERNAYLDQACADAPDIRRKVEELLRAYDEAGSFMESPAPAPAATVDLPPITEGPGTRIGPYKLLQQIGEGGMGVVYMAEQEQPVRRRVALKIIKPGMDSAQVIARFESERQALAMMDHPNIAKVLDAGTTDTDSSRGGTDRPYFVMELVKGVPITKYCDDNHLTPKERLALFIPVCQAIQHAHQKGVIHRDIKPSNVLVTLYDGHPVPKVIDFGVAKAIEQRLTERTLFTQYGQIVGTLEYMSPEQAEMNALDVDTRSDIYSLGVLLYELLTGSTPIEQKRVRSAGFDEIRRIIREEDPPKPSMRLSGSGDALVAISAQRKTEPAKLTRLVRGELDWIVMKALEKDRGRRYETASEFAADVGRYLRDDPVLASPPGFAYQLRKVCHRHRGPVMAAAAVMLTLLVGVIATGVMAVLAEQERRRAQESASDAEQKSHELAAAVVERGVALEERTKALDAKTKALNRTNALLLSSRAVLLKGENPEVAGALAIEAARRSPEPLTHRALLSALHEMPSAYRELEVHSKSIGPADAKYVGPARLAPWIRFTPSGREIVGVDHQGDFHVWDSTTGKRVRGFTGAASDVTSEIMSDVVLAPDGQRVAALVGNKLLLWKFATGEKERVLEPPRGLQFRQMAFSPDGASLAATCDDSPFGADAKKGCVYVWKLEPFEETILLAAKENFYSVNFSPDGKKLAATSPGRRRVRAWDLEAKRLLLEQSFDDGIQWLTTHFSPDGKNVLVVGHKGIHFWNLDNPTVGKHSAIPSLGEHNGNQYESSNSSGLLLTTSVVKLHLFDTITQGVGPVRLWDTRDLTVKQMFPDQMGALMSPSGITSGARRSITHATLTPDGRFVAIVVDNRNVEIWNTSTGNIEARLRSRIRPHFVRGLARGRPDESIIVIAIRPDAKSVAIVGGDGAGTICDVDDRGALPIYPRSEDVAPAYVDVGPQLSVLRANDGIAVLDPCLLRTQKHIPVKQLNLAHRSPRKVALAHSPETNRFAVRDSDSKVAIVDGSSGQVLVEVKRVAKVSVGEPEKMGFVAGGRRLLFRFATGEVELIDPHTGNTIHTLKGTPGTEGEFPWFRLSPDGRRFLLTVDTGRGKRYEFHIYDTESWQIVCKLQHHGSVGPFGVAAFSPDGLLVVTTFDEVTIEQQGDESVVTEHGQVLNVWSAKTGERVATLRGTKGARTTATVFAPDSKTLVTGTTGGVIRVWDIEAKSERLSFQAHKDGVRDVTISAKGTVLATQGHGESAGREGADLDAVIWDLRTGREILRVSGVEFGEFDRIAFAADDTALLTVSSSGILRSWPIDPVKHMEERGYRKLTPEERRQFELDEPSPTAASITP